MPTYEYACPKCGIFEAFQSIKEAPLERCPTCKRGKVTRLLSGGAGVIFKGSGFWETDYNRSGDYAKRAKSESGDKAVATGDSPPSTMTAKPAMQKAATPAKQQASSAAESKTAT